MPTNRVTCLVATHNRPQFLRRLLRFYTHFPPSFSFLVVDSSDPASAADNLSAIQRASGRLDISYEHFNLSITDKSARGLERVRTPFVVLCADDDVLFPEAVRRCAEFLESEPNYATAMGRIVVLDTTRPVWRRKMKVSKGYSIEHERPLDRCRQINSEPFSTYYAVYRTETLQRHFQIAAACASSEEVGWIPQQLLLQEVLLLQLGTLRGRVKLLPLVHAIWHRHGMNYGVVPWGAPDPQAERRYRRFKECLTDQFAEAGIDRLEAARLIDDWFGYLRDGGVSKRRRSTAERVRKLIRDIPERAADFIRTGRVRECPSVWPGDYAGCEQLWHAAVRLISEFPQGIPAEHESPRLCA